MKFMDAAIDWPLDSNIIRRNNLNNTFGMLRTNADGSLRPHQGWDLYAKHGTHCYSISDGVVQYVGTRSSLGLVVIVSIGVSGKYAAYCHLSETKVNLGDRVMLGQQIALTGNSGNAESMKGLDEHLHIEIRDKVITGKGLDDRISPLKVFGICPLNTPIHRS
jgi:murein DD-endopeptidase MepM/ murein hydrolase activator NlpD